MSAAAIISILSPLMPFVVKSLDRFFGSKTGSTKMDVAFSIIKKVIEELARGGRIPGLPADDTIKLAIESLVSDLNAKGELKGEATQIDTSSREGVKMILQGTLRILEGA